MPRKAGAVDTLPPITAGAVTVSIVMYPVDVVRAICMANPGTGAGAALSGFVQTHGMAGFVKQGLAAEVTRASFSRGIKFFLQPVAHRTFFGRPEAKGNPLTKGLSGAIATIPEVITISPLENFKLAEQLDKEKRFNGMSDVAKHLLKTRGFFGGFYIGYFGMQIRQCLWTGTFFCCLDSVKSGVTSLGVTNKLAGDVLSGFTAGALGVAVNCWTDVCRSVIQKQAVADTFNPAVEAPSVFRHINPLFFFGEAGKIASETGIAGLYAGVGPKMVHLGLGNSILFVLMPRFKTMWFDYKGLY
jgi:solute carrier family 25 2-oxodicarboxylate transporter 21